MHNNLTEYIKKKLKLVDNIGIKALISKTGFYAIGRPKKKKKPDNSDIPGLIEEMSQEQK